METHKFLLTIIMPAFNAERYIEEAIKSITNQLQVLDIEIIIIDDGSTDETKSVANGALGDVQNARVISVKNRGVSAARNTGVAMSRGEYLLFMDADDLLTDGAISYIKREIEDYEPDVICGSSLGFIASAKDDACSMGGYLNDSSIEELRKLDGQEAYNYVVSKGGFNAGIWANIYRKSIAIENNISFNTALSNNEDVDYVMRFFLECKKFTSLSNPHYYYRKFRKGSASNVYTLKRVESSLNFIESWIDKLSRDKIIPGLRVTLGDYIAYQYAILVGTFFLMKKMDRRLLKARVVSLKHLFSGGVSRKNRFVGASYRLLGFQFTGTMLALFIKFKGVFK